MKIPSMIVLLVVGGCASHTKSVRPSSPSVKAIALPGAAPEGVFMDYLAYDRAHRRVWVPAGNTGKVDVLDPQSGLVTPIDGFATKELERNGKKRIVGPSSASVGDGVVFVGNRGDDSVCAFDASSLGKRGCVTLDGMPDGLAWVAAAREVWATTPRKHAIVVIDASNPDALAVKQTIALDGQPEGYAVDDARGLFYTNLEDKDETLVLDVAAHAVKSTWQPGCGDDGPKGLALDRAANWLFVACADRVELLDAGHDGKQLSSLSTGDGVDNIDYVEARKELYAGAARAARLTVARVDERGQLVPAAVVPTANGARNAVAADDGTAFLTDSREGKILVVTPAARR